MNGKNIDDNVGNDGVGMVVVVVAESGTITFVPVAVLILTALLTRYPVSVPPPSSI